MHSRIQYSLNFFLNVSFVTLALPSLGIETPGLYHPRLGHPRVDIVGLPPERLVLVRKGDEGNI
jgi:hypothetical protein